MHRLTILLLALTAVSDGARILGVVSTPSYSHQIVFHPIFKELAARGHEVVLMTTDLIKDAPPTLKQIDWHHSYTIWNRDLNEMIKSYWNPLAFFFKMFEVIGEMSDYQLGHPEVQAIIHNETEHFDVVMAEISAISMLAFKERFNSPLILMSSMDAPSSAQEIFGNPVHYSMYPDMTLPFEGELSFSERVFSFVFMHFFNIFMRFSVFSDQRLLADTHFGKSYSLMDCWMNADMLFTNTNPAMNINRPVTPATIRIGGGMHIQPEKPLPKDLKQYLDDATDGFLYLSLGSNVKSKDLSEETRAKFMKAFSELPYKVLWKFEAEDLPGKPRNVRIMKWVPQQDVLRHPNIKAFITQGGLQSLEEAVFSHVPLICLPFFGDQLANAIKIENKGIGKKLDHKSMTPDDLKSAIFEVVLSSKYKNKAKQLAMIAKDEPMSSLEKAVWWTEYVIRHKGAQHLKGPSYFFPIYKYYYLDVISFLLVILSVVCFTTYFVCKKVLLLVIRLICKQKSKVD